MNKEEKRYCKIHPKIPLVEVEYENGSTIWRCALCDIEKADENKKLINNVINKTL